MANLFKNFNIELIALLFTVSAIFSLKGEKIVDLQLDVLKVFIHLQFILH